MATLEYFLLAESCSVDQRTNVVSLFHVIEEIRFSEFPSPIREMVVVAVWNAEPGDEENDFQTEIRFVLNGKNLKAFRHNFRIPQRRSRNFLTITGLPIEEPGTLKVELLLNGEHKAFHIVDVVKADPADSAATTE